MKFAHCFLIVFLSLFMLAGAAQAGSQGKKALMIVAPKDFEQTEYSKTRSALEDGGVICTVASSKVGKLKGNKGKRVTSEIELKDVVVADYDAIVIIGGNGIKKLWKNEEAHRIVREAADQGKVLGAICAGPGILAHAEVIQGKKATAHPKSGAKSIMKDKGCDYTGAKLEIDDKLITANGPKAASMYGKAIVDALN